MFLPFLPTFFANEKCRRCLKSLKNLFGHLLYCGIFVPFQRNGRKCKGWPGSNKLPGQPQPAVCPANRLAAGEAVLPIGFIILMRGDTCKWGAGRRPMSPPPVCFTVPAARPYSRCRLPVRWGRRGQKNFLFSRKFFNQHFKNNNVF